MKNYYRIFLLIFAPLVIGILVFFIWGEGFLGKLDKAPEDTNNVDQGEEKEMRERINPELEVSDLDYYRAQLTGRLTGKWVWVVEGRVKNTSEEVAVFITRFLELLNKEGEEMAEFEKPFKTNQFTREGYKFSRGEITKEVEKEKGFEEEVSLGESSHIHYKTLVNIPPNDNARFYFLSDLNKRISEANLEVKAESYFDNSPYYNQKYLKVKNISLERGIENINEYAGRGEGYNVKGQVYNPLDYSLENPYVFAKIFFKPAAAEGEKWTAIPLTCGYKIKDSIESKETTSFNFKDRLEKHNQRCFHGIDMQKAEFEIDEVEVFAWGWE